MRTAIFSLFQNKELDKFKFFLNQVSNALSSERQLFILINDVDNKFLREYVNKLSSNIHIFCEGTNLGVASGRNYLIRKAIEADFELFVSCDSDIIYQNGYFDEIEKSYKLLKSTENNLGVLQPVLLDGSCLIDELRLHGVKRWSDLLKIGLSFDGNDLRMKILRRKNDLKSIIYHAGISNVLHAHYTANRKVFKTIPDDNEPFEAFSYRTSLEILEEIIKSRDPKRISTAAGGVSIFDRDLIDRVGLYNKKFDPFLYEDSEFGFRVNASGAKSFLLSNLIAVHDVFISDSNRRAKQLSAIGKLRGVELGIASKDSALYRYMCSHSLFYTWRYFANIIRSKNRRASITADRANIGDQFFISYIISFLFGNLSGYESLVMCSPERNFFSRLTSKIKSGKEYKNVSIPISKNIDFKVGLFENRAVQNDVDLAIRCMNCRLWHNQSFKHSKYFDFYIVIKNLKPFCYEINVDIQSNDITKSLSFEIDVKDFIKNPYGENSNFSFSLSRFKSKVYDYGNFSKEDLYPSPNLTVDEVDISEMVDDFECYSKATNSYIVKALIRALKNYLSNSKEAAPSNGKDNVKENIIRSGEIQSESSCNSTKKTTGPKKRILIFTDSRGQHKPVGSSHDIFPERIANDDRFEVDMYLCPMKWTTTIDFLSLIEDIDISAYDHIILYTGIVEWSPRPQKSAINDLYNNNDERNINNWKINTRNYSEKIVNNKKKKFDDIFGEVEVSNHLYTPFEIEYEGQKTINMYSLTLALDRIIPRLNAIDNLIFINANRFVDGWEGDFKRGRPKNIDITHKYADLFAKFLDPTKILDLREWSENDVKKYTCDNIHLTKEGSDYIYHKLMQMMGVQNSEMPCSQGEYFDSLLEKDIRKLLDFKRFDPLSAHDRDKLLKECGVQECLGTLIIGIKLKEDDFERLDNLKFLLKWIDYYFSDLFDVLIVEQGTKRKLSQDYETKYKFLRYKFLYNPNEFNRGWGYNVAVEHYCKNSKAVALLDTDVLPGNNFVSDFLDCLEGRYKVVSPYQNIYYTNKAEVEKIKECVSFNFLNNSNSVKHPVTITGGMVIFDRQTYLSLKGFEQYVGYGCEDRSLDVLCLSMLDRADIRISPYAYPHLYHSVDGSARIDFDSIYQHLQKNYRCEWSSKLKKNQFIHKFCSHPSRSDLISILAEKQLSFADPSLYENGKDDLSANGIKLRKFGRRRNVGSVILPPEFRDYEYSQREIYDAPLPDSSEISKFRNAYLGQRCFIIGNGPSLNKHDLDLLKDEFTFGVNSFYYKTRETGFTPTFYVVEDSSVMRENLAEIKSYNAPFKFFPTVYKQLHPKSPNTFFFKMNRGFYEKSSPNYCVPRFSTDATKELFCGQSVTYINLQLAYFMGFTEVYLIGMDFSYVIPESHKRTGDVLLSDSDDPNHFHKDYFGKGKTWKDPKLERVGMNYRMAKLAYESTGREIFNATVGGSLEIFDRVDYYSLFSTSSHKDPLRSEISLKDANELLANKQYADALVLYVKLAEKNPNFGSYLHGVSYCLAWGKAKGQPLQTEIVQRALRILSR